VRISHWTHFGGLLAGLCVSYLFLPNLRDERWQTLMQRARVASAQGLLPQRWSSWLEEAAPANQSFWRARAAAAAAAAAARMRRRLSLSFRTCAEPWGRPSLPPSLRPTHPYAPYDPPPPLPYRRTGRASRMPTQPSSRWRWAPCS